MRAIPRILIAVLALMLSAATVAVADNGHRDNDRVSVVPADRVGGSSGGDLIGDWFAQLLAMPAADSPFGGTANKCLQLGRHGKVFAPAGGDVDQNKIEMTCPVKPGTPVVLVMTSADCSTNESDDFHAETAREQRKCAIREVKKLNVTSITVVVDGAAPVEIAKPRYFAVSPQRRTIFNDDPVFGGTPGPGTFVAAGWIAEIQGLTKGSHDIVATVDRVGGTPIPFIVHLNVGGRS